MKAANQKIICAVFILLALMSFQTIAQEKTKTEKEREIIGSGFEKKIANAAITKAVVVLTQLQISSDGESTAKTEKAQFDVILKSRIVTNKEGEFIINIPIDQFNKIPETTTFELKLKIKPSKEFVGIYKTDEAVIKLKQSAGPKYELILIWIPDAVKTNKGTFAVSSRAQT
ncbi:MAG: hypothetical protein AB1432_03440 [Bacteroidota bacterium]